MILRIRYMAVVAALALVSVFSVAGCSLQQEASSDPQETESVAAVEAEESPVEAQEEGGAEANAEAAAEIAELATAKEPEPAYEAEVSLDDKQRNSLAMLNYLAVLTERINVSKNSRLSLEEYYSGLINNTNPKAVDDRTLAQLEGILDTLEDYRMIAQKRERLQFIYEQNQAQAIREAVPNPLGLLSAVQSGDLVKLAASVAYMAVDSYTSYQGATAAADLEYLTDGWELDDEEAAVLHQRRKDTFAYMVRIVQDYNLPGDSALSESDVEKLVSWRENDNIVSRIQSLEYSKDTYKSYGGYWLLLAQSYYEQSEYQKCLDAIASYEDVQAKIMRKDYEYGKAMPAAIAAAAEVMDDAAYKEYAEEHIAKLLTNCDKEDWGLRYFAAQCCIDLSRRTGDSVYLQTAYDIALNNVNLLVDEQKSLNSQYLAEVKKVSEPAGATKAQKEEVKQLNKMLKVQRKTELPPVYQPLAVNCDLLFALADELGVSDQEKAKIDGILHQKGERIFLTQPLDEMYRFEKADDAAGEDSIALEKSGRRLVIPAELVSSRTTVEVKNGSGEAIPGEWAVKEVKRETEGELSGFLARFENGDAKNAYANGDTVTVTLTDDTGGEPIVRTYEFKVSVNERPLFIPNGVGFERES